MSEMEELKANADKSKYMQQMKELNAYLDTLTERGKRQVEECQRALLIMLGAIAVMLALTFMGGIVFNLIGTVVFWFSFGYMMSCDRALAKVGAEFKGAFKVLKILGYSDFDWDDIGNKRKKKILSGYTDLVKSWFTQKKEAQDKVYSPA